MKIFFGFLLIWSAGAFAEVSLTEAESMIDEMVKSNTISSEEALKAKIRLQVKNSDERLEIRRDSPTRMPASVTIADPSVVDLAEEQFAAIQSDLRIIAPHTVPETRPKANAGILRAKNPKVTAIVP